MAVVKYTIPPQTPPSGQGTFADNLVGVQLVEGGGLTNANFEFLPGVTEKSNRDFITGVFSEPMSLNSMGISSDFQDREILAKDFRVYPNYDLTQVSNFSTFGSLSKRMSVSIEKVINYFPAALEVFSLDANFNTGLTAYDAFYDVNENQTEFKIPVVNIRNPFVIDFTVNSTRNITTKEVSVSQYRDLNTTYTRYSLFYKGVEYPIVDFTPSNDFTSGFTEFVVEGNPFMGASYSLENIVIRPNTYYTNTIFNENFDEIEKFLLNRLSNPVYTAVFDVPQMTDNGTYYFLKQTVTWPIDGIWNIDIRTPNFDSYIELVGDIAISMDEFKTNIVSRFLTTGAFKEFDTQDQKVEKILQIYGREFDEVRKYIDSLATINSVNYNVGNDVPSQLLKNIAETIGWGTNISPISETDFLDSVFGTTNISNFPGYSRTLTPTELNYQYYRNIILNSAYLFKSKGTRKSIEALMALIGAPQALVEFNETIYLADGKINMEQFNEQFAQISGGTYTTESVTLDPNNVYTIYGQPYTGYTTTSTTGSVYAIRENYPVDEYGLPTMPLVTENFYFQKGEGWFEQTPQHRSQEVVDITNSVYTGQNPDIQTKLAPFTYGQQYLDVYRKFPYMDFGFNIREQVENKKSWTDSNNGLRVNREGGYNSYYYTDDESLVLNVKNIDLFMNPGQGTVYDVWSMSQTYGYPIPNGSQYSPVYPPSFSGASIVIQPNKESFFEFAQTFWRRMIDVRNRQYTTDGKTSGYPTLQSVFWKYLESYQTSGITNNNFTYQKLIDYVDGLGDYWVRLVEQMIPATTIWKTGTKYENNVFNRQKFVYKRQRGCVIVAVPCLPCTLNSQLFDYDCTDETSSCSIYPWDNQNTTATSFSDILYQALNNFLSSEGLTINDCLLNSLVTNWFIDLRIDNNILIQNSFYNGFGINGVPTNQQWKTALNNNLSELFNDGYNYYFINDMLYISNLGCVLDIKEKNLELNVGINIQINCSNANQ